MPFEAGKTRFGWGVYRSAPWHFVGMFDTKDDAAAKASEMGEGYEVALGENQAGTDNFIKAGKPTHQ
jgi:hypothetical protein